MRMSKPRRSAVKKYHDRVAGRYDQTYDDPFWKWHDALTWDYLKPFLPRDANAKVADLGCGTGKWGAKIAKSGYAVTFVDVSYPMIERTRQRIGQLGGAARADFLHADLCDLSELSANEFALAVALGDPIGYTESPARALKQIRRILRHDGVLIATFDNRLAGIDYYLSGGDPQALSHFLRDGMTRWLTKDASEQFPIATFTPGGVRGLVEGAGFEVVDLLGKTVLDMRHHRRLLASAEERRKWARIEKGLCRDVDAIGRASHVQVACRLVEG
ncbi:MAG: methyltransferase domain-containing protein [Phycisphaerales bacterium]|nr:MAG: methyltransferase domain-containing protein [Phycisphaerales bacterium]